MKSQKFKRTEIGKIPEDWKETTLGNLLKSKGYIRGPFGSSLRRPELKREGIPVYEQEHAIYDRRSFRYFIDNEKYQSMKRFTVEENDLIISCSGTFGKVSIIKEKDPKGIISQALLILRPDTNKVNPNYLKYFFTSKRGFGAIASRSLGSVQVNIAKREVIENIPFSLPPLPEQHSIAKILSSLDEKIELNNKMNKTLEAIGQVLFKKWFIDNPERKEWETSTIGEELKTILGGTPSRVKPEYWGGNINWINSGKINEFRIIEPSEKITEEGLSKSATKLLPKGAIVLAITGATLGQVSRLEIDSCANQSVIGVLENKYFSSPYIYYWVKNKIGDIVGHQTGGAQQHINKGNIDNYELLVPNEQTLKKFDNTIKSVFKQISVNCFQNQTLAQIRDTLLPKLMSGEIRVLVS